MEDELETSPRSFMNGPLPRRAPAFGGNPVRERFRSILNRVPIPASNTYTYQRIEHDNKIRILKVFHGKKDSALECMLFPTRLPDSSSKSDGLDRYRALSFVWGPDEPVQKITIFNDTGGRGKLQSMTPFNLSGVFHIRNNLAAALKQLRLEHEDVNLWVDALCINQADDEEKNLQVPLMHQIYSQAQDVCVWLGEDKELKSKETLDFLVSIEDLQSWGYVADNPSRWNLVYKLLKTEGFSQIWLIQRPALWNKVVLRWGSEEIAWSTLSITIDLLVRRRAEIEEKIRKQMGTGELDIPATQSILDNWNRSSNLTIDQQAKLLCHWASISADQKHPSGIESSETDETVASFGPAPEGGESVKFETSEDTDSDVSVASLESFAASTIASSATSLSEMLSVARDSAKEIANLISNDDQLRKLLDKAFDLLEPERVIRNFRRALRSFSQELIDEAGTVPQEHAAKFVGQNSRQIAVLVRQIVRPGDHLLLPSNDVDETCQERLQTYLASSQFVMRPESFPTIVNTGVGDEDSDEEEAENDVSDNHPDLTKLREWLLTASAMQGLRDRFRVFLYPEKLIEPKKRENITAETEAETSQKLQDSQTLPEDSKDYIRQDQESVRETTPNPEPEYLYSSLSFIWPFLKPFNIFLTAWNYINSKRSLGPGVVRLEWTCVRNFLFPSSRLLHNALTLSRTAVTLHTTTSKKSDPGLWQHTPRSWSMLAMQLTRSQRTKHQERQSHF